MSDAVWSEYPIEVVWEEGKRYRGGAPGGPSMVLDGDRAAGPSPVDSLLVALGACSAIDVVEILQKRRTPVEGLRVRLEFARAATPPRRLVEVRAHFAVETASALQHVERAAELSFEKYCSVSKSLAPDTRLTWTVEVGKGGGT